MRCQQILLVYLFLLESILSKMTVGDIGCFLYEVGSKRLGSSTEGRSSSSVSVGGRSVSAGHRSSSASSSSSTESSNSSKTPHSNSERFVVLENRFLSLGLHFKSILKSLSEVKIMTPLKKMENDIFLLPSKLKLLIPWIMTIHKLLTGNFTVCRVDPLSVDKICCCGNA